MSRPLLGSRPTAVGTGRDTTVRERSYADGRIESHRLVVRCDGAETLLLWRVPYGSHEGGVQARCSHDVCHRLVPLTRVALHHTHMNALTKKDILNVNMGIATHVAETCTIFLPVSVMSFIINPVVSKSRYFGGALGEEGF